MFSGHHLVSKFSRFYNRLAKLEMDIMAGCTISPLALTMTMEVNIRPSKWVVGGERHQNRMHLPPVRTYMNDMTWVAT